MFAIYYEAMLLASSNQPVFGLREQNNIYLFTKLKWPPLSYNDLSQFIIINYKQR